MTEFLMVRWFRRAIESRPGRPRIAQAVSRRTESSVSGEPLVSRGVGSWITGVLLPCCILAPEKLRVPIAEADVAARIFGRDAVAGPVIAAGLANLQLV